VRIFYYGCSVRHSNRRTDFTVLEKNESSTLLNPENLHFYVHNLTVRYELVYLCSWGIATQHATPPERHRYKYGEIPVGPPHRRLALCFPDSVRNVKVAGFTCQTQLINLYKPVTYQLGFPCTFCIHPSSGLSAISTIQKASG
jgi:hypothetical protein